MHKMILVCLTCLILSCNAFAENPILLPPSSVIQQHDQIKTELEEAMQAGGKTGAAAKNLAKLVLPHLQEQTEFVFPPLGLLPFLTSGAVTPDMKEALSMTEKARDIYPQVLSIHEAILSEVQVLVDAAKSENKLEYVNLANRIRIYIRMEEQIFYPAAILVGNFIAMKLGNAPAK